MELQENIGLIVFDLDGTLVNLPIDWRRVKKITNTAPNQTLGQRLEELIQQNDQRILDQVRHIELRALDEAKIDPSFKATVGTLLNSYKVAILTRNSRTVAEALLQLFNLHNKNIYIVGRENVERLKPHPQGLQLILNHFKLTREQTIMVGDTYHDIELAKATKLKAVIMISYGADEQDNIYRADRLSDVVNVINKLSGGGSVKR